MKRTKEKQYLFFIIVLIFALSACTSNPDFDLYEGKPLRIAVVGVPPKVKEEQVSFIKISFDEMISDNLKDYDAVFVMKENLLEAAESQYADFYLSSIIPVFFISTKSHVPFTEKDIEFEESWGWAPGNSYAVGVLSLQKNHTFKHWEFGLYNDEKTDAHIEDLYSRIFKTIEENKLEL
ncbi:hypothetical protein [Paenibacillus sp. CF384]|uniref:hypothetical protein n=1 Tax=Paenibacillus sp. CF384 TaxID=1884382 RepID=UPI000896AB12|nr:hypothetical protein [Paenibacillus sp. CF384]SDX06405.1 hypothetical protein SAMN05518855_1008121 [Paenibacillus sp. CF384]